MPNSNSSELNDEYFFKNCPLCNGPITWLNKRYQECLSYDNHFYFHSQKRIVIMTIEEYNIEYEMETKDLLFWRDQCNSTITSNFHIDFENFSKENLLKKIRLLDFYS